MIFGEEIQHDKQINFGINSADDPEDILLNNRKRNGGSDSENSDDYLFGNDSKYIYFIKEIIVS